MHIITVILLIVAASCFTLAAIGVPRCNWLALGLLAWLLTVLIPALQR